MIRINLIGREPARPKRRRAMPEITLGGSENLPFVAAVLVTLLLIGAGWWYQSRQLSRLQSRLAQVQAERQELADTVAKVETFEERKALINQKLDVIVQLKRQQTGPVLMLDQISRLLPDSLWLTMLEARQGGVSIQGSALSNVAIADFVSNLNNSPYFTDVELRLTEDTGDAFRFQLNCRFTPRPGTPSPQEAGTRATTP